MTSSKKLLPTPKFYEKMDEEIKETFIRKCFIVSCDNPRHQFSRYCINHCRAKKTERELRWEKENAKTIAEDIKRWKIFKKEHYGKEKEDNEKHNE
jgi:hypothetical protein